TGATSWSWNFDDGTTSTERSPHHTFTGQRTYNVTLTVSNGDQSVTRTRAISVGAAPSVANFDFTPATGITTDTLVQFNDRSAGGKPTSYQWDFDDNGATSTQASPTHKFGASRVYDVKLTVSNGGTPSTKVLPVNVAPATASFNVLGTRRIAGEPIGFQNLT